MKSIVLLICFMTSAVSLGKGHSLEEFLAANITSQDDLALLQSISEMKVEFTYQDDVANYFKVAFGLEDKKAILSFLVNNRHHLGATMYPEAEAFLVHKVRMAPLENIHINYNQFNQDDYGHYIEVQSKTEMDCSFLYYNILVYIARNGNFKLVQDASPVVEFKQNCQ